MQERRDFFFYFLTRQLSKGFEPLAKKIIKKTTTADASVSVATATMAIDSYWTVPLLSNLKAKEKRCTKHSWENSLF